MAKQQKIFLTTGAGVLVLGAIGATILRFDHHATGRARVDNGAPVATPGVHIEIYQTVQAPPGVLNLSAQQKLDSLNAGDQATVDTFLANTPGPLDNYLLHLEGTTDVANARYGEPDQVAWAQALPVARVLVEGMCDCAQRNWLNQFIALGEAGQTGDLAKYHAQGEVMATIGRSNNDAVNKQVATTGGEQ